MKYKDLFDSKLLADFKLKTNDKTVLKAHKAILASQSPVISAMLQHNMKEAKENMMVVPDFDSTTMNEFLRFVYYNEVEDLPATAHKLVYAAEKYQIDDLKEICIDEILSSLSVDNVLSSIEIAERIPGTRNLFDECFGLITR